MRLEDEVFFNVKTYVATDKIGGSLRGAMSGVGFRPRIG